MRTDEYVQAARELFVPETNCAEVYYQFREEFNKSQDPFRRAVLFLYLNRYGTTACVVTICAVSLTCRLAATKNPISRKQSCITSLKKRRMPFSIVSLTPIAWRAQMMHLSSIAIRLMRRCLRLPTLRRITQQFTLEQQAHLAEIAEGLVDRHIPVLISNHDTMLTREWYHAQNCMSSKFDAV